MDKKFLIINRGEDAYSSTQSQLEYTDNLVSIDSNLTLRDVTKFGNESDVIVLRKPVLYNDGIGFTDGLFGTDVTNLIQLSNGGIIAFGDFTEYNDIYSPNLFKLDINGAADYKFREFVGTFSNFTIFTGLNNILVDTNDSFWVVGSFDTYAGVSASGIVKILPDGNIDTSFDYGTGFNNPSYRATSITKDTVSDSVYVVGYFTTYRGSSIGRIIKLNPDGTKDSSFVPGVSGFDNTVNDVKVDEIGNVYCCGSFAQYKGVTSSKIAKLDRYGNLDINFISGSSFNNSSLILSNDTSSDLYVLGNFTSYKGTIANRIIKIDSSTGDIDLGFTYGGGFNAATVTMHRNDDGSIYIGGAFTTYDSNPFNRIIKLLSDGSIDFTFDSGSGFNGTVYSIIEKDGVLIVGGDFTIYNGIACKNIIKLLSDGSVYTGTELSFTNGKAEYNIKSLEFTSESEVLPKSLIREFIYESEIIETDYNTIFTDLIPNKSLIKGVVYNITDAEGLYSIYLNAVEDNKLSNDGHGLFYTPKYDTDVPGYGIWNNHMEGFTLGSVATFSINEYLNGNNGTVGIYKYDNLIEWVSGNWSLTTVITGSSSGYTASISGVVSPSYATNSNVIWGGKHWINKDGNVGSMVDKYELSSSSWRAVDFNPLDYNTNIDIIKYDVDVDTIFYRKDKFNNEVSTTYNRISVELNGNYYSSIKDFQWGNGYYGIQITYYLKKGVIGNKIHNSYLDCLNSMSTIWYNSLDYTFINNCLLYKSTFNLNRLSNTTISNDIYISSEFSGNSFDNVAISSNIIGGAFTENILTNFIISTNIVGDGSISRNDGNNGSLQGNIMKFDDHLDYNSIDSSSINDNIFGASSYIQYNKLLTSFVGDNTINGNIEGNDLINALITNNTTSDISYNKMNNSVLSDSKLTGLSSVSRNDINSTTMSHMTFSSTLLVDSEFNCSYFNLIGTSILSNKTIQLFTCDGVTNIALNLSTASIIFGDYPKVLYKRPDGVNRIRYYNNSDVVVIGDYFI